MAGYANLLREAGLVDSISVRTAEFVVGQLGLTGMLRFDYTTMFGRCRCVLVKVHILLTSGNELGFVTGIRCSR
jgi:hypothetical protein